MVGKRLTQGFLSIWTISAFLVLLNMCALENAVAVFKNSVSPAVCEGHGQKAVQHEAPFHGRDACDGSQCCVKLMAVQADSFYLQQIDIQDGLESVSSVSFETADPSLAELFHYEVDVSPGIFPLTVFLASYATHAPPRML